MTSTFAKPLHLLALFVLVLTVACAAPESAPESAGEHGEITSEDFESGASESLQERQPAEIEEDEDDEEQPDEGEPQA